MADAEDHESEMGVTYSPEEYAAHMEERKTLIEATRESAKTFDQAIGAHVFTA